MKIYETARELGTLILESEEAAILAQIKEELANEEASQKLLDDYNHYRTEIQKKMQSGKITKEDFSKASEALSKKAAELKSDPFISRMLYAESEFNSLVNRILSIIRATITGEDHEEPSCSGCSGSCGDCH